MGLYERLLGTEGAKIPVHGFQAALAEFGRGKINGTQAQAIIESLSGEPLTPAEVTEAQTLLSTVTNAGGATAKLARVKEIEDVLVLAEPLSPGYDTPAQVKTRLGV